MAKPTPIPRGVLITRLLSVLRSYDDTPEPYYLGRAVAYQEALGLTDDEVSELREKEEE